MRTSNPPRSQLQFALIGCGLVGRNRVAALGSQAVLRFACDLEGARAAELAATVPDCQAIGDYNDAVRSPEVTAVIVATPNASLAPIALAADRNGKHVLVEKPGAIHSSQLRELQAAAARNARNMRRDIEVADGEKYEVGKAVQVAES